MSKVYVHRVHVQFGDCDPAGIVFFPNFSRWMDEASLLFFMSCGVPPWRELVKTRHIIGTPLLEIHTRFMKAATYGEWIEVHTSVEEWAVKVFRHRHVIKRGDDVLCEGTEVRTFAIRDPQNPERIHVLAEPPSIDKGELTDKGSINQRAVLQHRASLVDALYEGEASDPFIIRARGR